VQDSPPGRGTDQTARNNNAEARVASPYHSKGEAFALRVYDGPTGTGYETIAMTRGSADEPGVWSVTGESDWNGTYYQY
jgi:hypothetical protein